MVSELDKVFFINYHYPVWLMLRDTRVYPEVPGLSW